MAPNPPGLGGVQNRPLTLEPYTRNSAFQVVHGVLQVANGRQNPYGGGGEPEQLTHLNTNVTYPAPIDERTVLFIAHSQNGAGRWLCAFSQRVSSGLEQYTALATAAGGRRLAAIKSQVKLWSVPITGRIVEEKDVTAFPVPTARAQAPRFGGGSLFYFPRWAGLMDCGAIAMGKRWRWKMPDARRCQHRTAKLPKGWSSRDAGNMSFTPPKPWPNKNVCASCWPKVESS